MGRPAVLFWIRELAGWILVAAGIVLFWFALAFLGNRQVIEGAVVAVIGIVVFRGGIHLIKVATAAQVVLRARRETASSTSRQSDPTRAAG
jgi:hypothetical protein